MNTIVKRTLVATLSIAAAFICLRLLDLLMVGSVYSRFFTTVRNAAGTPDLLTGAISIWLTAAFIMLVPTFLSALFLRRTLKKVLIIASALSAWMVIVFFLSQPRKGQYFNPITGQAMYTYYQSLDGEIELFPLGYRYHPKYGTSLEILNPKVIADLELQKKQKAELQQKQLQEQEAKRFQEEQQRTALEEFKEATKKQQDELAKENEDLKSKMTRQDEQRQQEAADLKAQLAKQQQEFDQRAINLKAEAARLEAEKPKPSSPAPEIVRAQGATLSATEQQAIDQLALRVDVPVVAYFNSKYALGFNFRESDLPAIKTLCGSFSSAVFKVFVNGQFADVTAPLSTGFYAVDGFRYGGSWYVNSDNMKAGNEGNDIQVILCDKMVKQVKAYRRNF